jgi:hypothetical protein
LFLFENQTNAFMNKAVFFLLCMFFILSCNTERKKKTDTDTAFCCDSLSVLTDKMQQEIDSLLSLVMYQEKKIKQLVADTQSLAYQPLKVNVMQGKFSAIARNECFSLIFTDTSGTEWDFGSANNNLGIDLYSYDYTSDKFYFNKDYKDAEFRIYWAMLRNIVCEDGSEMPDKNQEYKEMPTILKAERIKK